MAHFQIRTTNYNGGNRSHAIFKNSALFTDHITKINNTQVDDAQKIDAVMPMYNSIEYSDAYSKTPEILWQYYKDEPPLKYNGDIIDFPENNNNSNPFKFKQKITGQTGNGGTEDVKIIILLK